LPRKSRKTPQGSGDSPQRRLLKALNHPTRTRALAILSDHIASPKDISDTLGEELSSVSYHVRVLHDLGLVDIVREDPVRGSLAHYYKAVERPNGDDPHQARLGVEQRTTAFSSLLETLLRDALEALASGASDRQQDSPSEPHDT
jgi:DNA-binding transcriptional ArsR family regulator